MPADQPRPLPRTARLPGMDRLCAVWDSPQPETTNFEHATHVALGLWMTALDGVDGHDTADWNHRLRDPDHATIATTIAQIIDDEVTWTLGNRPEAVILTEEHEPRPLTVGDLIYRLTMLLAVSMHWPADLGPCPMLDPFQRFGRDYDTLITGLNAGNALQPRLRSAGPLPIQRPPRIDLIQLPRN